jgi:preprotein translocase subunit YajC
MGPLLVLILLFVVMYAVMIRPQQKRARDHQALIAAVEVGDEVMTTAGIFGTVTDVEGDVIGVEISPGVVMRVARAGIGRRISAELEQYEAGETFDDMDDELGDSVADESAPTDGEGSTPTPSAETPSAPPPPVAPAPAEPPPVAPARAEPPPVAPAPAEPPPVTAPPPETPPMQTPPTAPGGPPAAGSAPGEPT